RHPPRASRAPPSQPSPAGGGRGKSSGGDPISPPSRSGGGSTSPRQRRFLDPADLVAYPGGVLELQVPGVLVHLLLQRLELRRQPGRVERRIVLGLVGHPPRLARGRARGRGLVARAF